MFATSSHTTTSIPAVTGGRPLTTSRRHPGIFPTFSHPQSITPLSVCFTLFPLLLLSLLCHFFLPKISSHLMFSYSVSQKKRPFLKWSFTLKLVHFLFSFFFFGLRSRVANHTALRYPRDLHLSCFPFLLFLLFHLLMSKRVELNRFRCLKP